MTALKNSLRTRLEKLKPSKLWLGAKHNVNEMSTTGAVVMTTCTMVPWVTSRGRGYITNYKYTIASV